MIRNRPIEKFSSPKGPGPADGVPDYHWTQLIRETIVSAFHDDLPITIEGGADNGQFCWLGAIKSDKINYHGGKLNPGDIVLEIQGQKIAGYTQRDASLWLKQVSQNGAPVMIKAVPLSGSLPKELSAFLITRFKKGSVDHDLQQIIRDNLYMRTVPCTTRPPKAGEINGVDYHFLTIEEFHALERTGELLESGNFEGNLYGTPRPAKEPQGQLIRRSQSMGLPGAQTQAGPAGKERKRTRSSSEAAADDSDLPSHGLTRKKSLEKAHSSSNLGPLPPNWEMAFTDDGHPYFIDHNKETTHWLDPRLAPHQKEKLSDCKEDELPYGWEKVEDPHYGIYYIDHVNRRTQYENPVHSARKQTDDAMNSSGKAALSDRQKQIRGPLPLSSDGNMNGLTTLTRRAFFTKNPDELKGEFSHVSLVKSVRGLGFTIVGGNYKDTQFLQIKNVVENGPAYLSGKLKTGDVIVRVNNICVLGFTHQDVVRLFQSIAPGETVQLETCRGYPLNFDPDDPNTEIVTTVAVTLPADAGTSNVSSTAMSNGFLDSNPHSLRAGMKSLPDLTRSALVQGHKSSSSLSPSNSHDDSGLHNLMNHHDEAIPDLVSLSINSRPEMLTIPIVKGPMGFGFTIADSPYGQRVKQILDQPRCKNLAEGDLLLMINSVNVSDLPHQQTVQVLKECKQDEETIIVVQRGGIPNSGKGKRSTKTSSSSEDRFQHPENGALLKGSSTSDNQNSRDIDDTDRAGLPSKVQSHDQHRALHLRSPDNVYNVQGKFSSIQVGSPKQNNLDQHASRRDYRDPYDSSRFNTHHSRPDLDGYDMGKPSLGPNRPDYFPRFDSRLRGGDPRSDPFQRQFSSMQNHISTADDRQSYSRDIKPGQFRSRTPGPELMSRSGPGPDISRSEIHRPKTPTAADMRNSGKTTTQYSSEVGDYRVSGRFTPNPSSEYGRQFKPPYQEYGRNRPDFSSPPPQRRYEPFENPSLNRSYAGEFPRPAFPSSVGPGRPLRQSTSFENETPTPSNITRLPQRPPPPHPAFHGLSPRSSQSRGIPEEDSGRQAIEMTVTLHRQENGYGFRIIGGTEEGSQVSVGHIVPGGAADLDGRLRQFDEITHVDNCSVLNASHHRVVQLMTNAALNGHVTLSVRRIVGSGTDSSSSFSPQYPYDVVVSRRENEGFGFVIISSVNRSGASVDEFIGHIQDNSPAARCGRLHVGDRILAVNGIDTSNMHHKDVVNLIKDSGYSVALTVGPPPPDESSGTPSQRSSQGSLSNSVTFQGDRPDLSLQSLERSHPGPARDLSRSRTHSNQSSDDGEIYQVELFRGSRGFGFSIRGGREFNAMPLFVLRIADDGAADLDGRLRVGDQILSINGFNTDNMTHTEAIEIIQNGGPSVSLVMRRTNKPPPIFEMSPSSHTELYPPSSHTELYPPGLMSNGPVSHSSPHMSRRQFQQPPPPPPSDLHHYPHDGHFHGYPVASSHGPLQQQTQHRRFNNY